MISATCSRLRGAATALIHDSLSHSSRHCTRTSVHFAGKPCRRLARNFSSESAPVGNMKKQSPLPFMGLTVVLCGSVAITAKVYSDYKKKLVDEEKKKQAEESKKNVTSKGTPLLGGPFTLVDTDGNTVTDKDFLGKWIMIYFGFTFCPDICPEELEKIGDIVNLLDKTPSAPKVYPIFISVDPKRDTPEKIKTYLEDFHPRFVGLTGTRDQVKRATKSYRVYFSEGPEMAGNANEYIVDHSIVTFLVDPAGQFQQHFGQRITAEEAAEKVVQKMNEFHSAS